MIKQAIADVGRNAVERWGAHIERRRAIVEPVSVCK
jgi:hypothetical protein